MRLEIRFNDNRSLKAWGIGKPGEGLLQLVWSARRLWVFLILAGLVLVRADSVDRFGLIYFLAAVLLAIDPIISFGLGLTFVGMLLILSLLDVATSDFFAVIVFYFFAAGLARSVLYLTVKKSQKTLDSHNANGYPELKRL